MKIDIEFLKNTIDDDPEFLAGVLETFESDLKETLPVFEELQGTKDLYLMGRKAHKLLSSSQLFGLTHFSEALKKMEIISENEDDTNAEAQLNTVIASTKDCIAALHLAKEQLNS